MRRLFHEVQQAGSIIEVDTGPQPTAGKRRELNPRLRVRPALARDGGAKSVRNHRVQGPARARGNFFRLSEEPIVDRDCRTHASKCVYLTLRCQCACRATTGGWLISWRPGKLSNRVGGVRVVHRLYSCDVGEPTLFRTPCATPFANGFANEPLECAEFSSDVIGLARTGDSVPNAREANSTAKRDREIPTSGAQFEAKRDHHVRHSYA